MFKRGIKIWSNINSCHGHRGCACIQTYVKYTHIPGVHGHVTPHSNEQTKFAQFSFLHGKTKAEIMQNDQYFSLYLDWNDLLCIFFHQNGSFQKNSLLKSSLFDDFYYWRLRLFFTQIGDFSGYFWTSPGYISEKVIGNTGWENILQ